MSLNTQTNKWTPKLIVIFQLTVWSVVGILLLRKGAKSLRAIEETLRNDTADTQESITKRNENKLSQESAGIAENRHRIAEIVTRQKDVVLAFDSSETTKRNGIWLSLKSYAPYRANDIFVKKQTTIDRKQDPRGIRAIQTLSIRTSNENNDEHVNKRGSSIHTVATPDKSLYVKEKSITDKDTSNALLQTNSDTTNFTALTSIDKFEKKLQRIPVNRIGVAVAITMLAIGVVMLLLGPLIVILRAYSDRRRCRQIFLKSRCHADRPPTYEEAVLMDQAPRYSTLQLDTAFESSFSL